MLQYNRSNSGDLTIVRTAMLSRGLRSSWCEDGHTLFIWYTLADGRQALSTYTLGGPIGQAQTPPHIVA